MSEELTQFVPDTSALEPLAPPRLEETAALLDVFRTQADGVPVTEWVVTLTADGRVGVFPTAARSKLPEPVQSRLAAGLTVARPRTLKARSFSVFGLERFERGADFPGVNDPVALVGHLTKPSELQVRTERGALHVGLCELLEGLVRGAQQAWQTGSSAAPARYLHALLAGAPPEQVQTGAGIVLIYPLPHPSVSPLDAGNEQELRQLLADLLHTVREQLEDAGQEVKLAVPAVDRPSEVVRLQAAGYTVRGQKASRPRPAWYGHLWKQTVRVPEQGTVEDFLQVASDALAAVPQWPSEVAAALRARLPLAEAMYRPVGMPGMGLSCVPGPAERTPGGLRIKTVAKSWVHVDFVVEETFPLVPRQTVEVELEHEPFAGRMYVQYPSGDKTRTCTSIDLEATEKVTVFKLYEVAPPEHGKPWRLELWLRTGWPVLLKSVRVRTSSAVQPGGTVASDELDGWLDGVTEAGSVQGWALDHKEPEKSIQVRVYLDKPPEENQTFVEVPASRDRPDVNAARKVAGKHGFEVLLPNERFDDGQHTLFAVAVNGTRTKLLQGSGKSFKLPSRARKPLGCLEALSEDGVARGWAFLPDDPAVPVTVHLRHALPDGTYRDVARTVTKLPRLDVNEEWRRHGHPGFECPLEDVLWPGEYKVHAFASLPKGGEVELPGGPLTFVQKQAPSFAAVAPPQATRVVFYDPRYAALWIGAPGQIAHGLGQHGFTQVDANGLRSWMLSKIEAGAPGSVCVFAQDVGPETVAETPTTECTLRRYLEAGGRVVWFGDVPFAYFATNGGLRSDVRSKHGPLGILSIGAWTQHEGSAEITEAGKQWGLTVPDQVSRCHPARDVTLVLSQSKAGTAASWFKNFSGKHPMSGFLRLGVGNVDGKDDKVLEQLRAAALHGLT